MNSARGGAADRRYSVDLLAIVAVAIVGTGLYVVLPKGVPELRVAISLALVFLAPGYALVSLVYPRRRRPDDAPALRSHGFDRWFLEAPRVTVLERFALSLAVGLVILPVVAGGVLVATGSLDPGAILLVVSTLTVLAAVGAYARRRSLPPGERYGVSVSATFDSIAGTSVLDTTLNVVLVLLVLVAATGLGYAMLDTNEEERYTSFALLSENEEGDFVAGNYPTEYQRGESQSMAVRVVNQERESVDYTVVVLIERVETEDGETRVLQDTVHRRFEVELNPGESWTRPHEVSPPMTGENLRVRYLLYRDDPGENPDTDDAYRDLYIWITVTG